MFLIPNFYHLILDKEMIRFHFPSVSGVIRPAVTLLQHPPASIGPEEAAAVSLQPINANNHSVRGGCRLHGPMINELITDAEWSSSPLRQ